MSSTVSSLKKYKTFLIFGVVALLVALGGTVYWKLSEKKELEAFDQREAVYRKGAFADFKGGKLEAQEFFKEVVEAFGKFQGFPPLDFILVEAADLFLKKEHPKLVLDLFESYKLSRGVSPWMRVMAGLSMASAHEDLGNHLVAIDVLRELLSFEVLQGRVYFDLGRYYLATGNILLAEGSFNHVREKFPDSHFSKLAEGYTISLRVQKGALTPFSGKKPKEQVKSGGGGSQ